MKGLHRRPEDKGTMDHYAAQRLLYEEVPASADELSDEEEEGATGKRNAHAP